MHPRLAQGAPSGAFRPLPSGRPRPLPLFPRRFYRGRLFIHFAHQLYERRGVHPAAPAAATIAGHVQQL